MGFEIINKLKKEQGLTNAQLAAKAGITLSTLDKITAGVNTNPKLDTLLAICRALGCRLDDFDDAPHPADGLHPVLSREGSRLGQDYDRLDSHGQRTLRTVADLELDRLQADRKPAAEPTKVIPLFGAAFAAGHGEPDFGNLWEEHSVPVSSPAQFAIRVSGDSMEPYLHDGSIAYGRKETPRDGDVGAFLLDGSFLVKQVCQDVQGNIYLFSLNRLRADADVTVYADSERSLLCFGTILLQKRVPLPRI